MAQFEIGKVQVWQTLVDVGGVSLLSGLGALLFLTTGSSGLLSSLLQKS